MSLGGRGGGAVDSLKSGPILSLGEAHDRDRACWCRGGLGGLPSLSRRRQGGSRERRRPPGSLRLLLEPGGVAPPADPDVQRRGSRARRAANRDRRRERLVGRRGGEDRGEEAARNDLVARVEPLGLAARPAGGRGL